MASKCPKCGEKLGLFDIKAECKHCGANIPNYNWEARLEEDNKIAEEKFQKLYHTMNSLRYSVAGTRLRIARLVMSFLPAIGFILPWAQLKSDTATVSFDLLGLFTDGKSTIDFFGIFFGRFGEIINSVLAGNPSAFMIYGFLAMLLSIVSIVAAFFLIFIKCKKPKTKAVCVADIISIIFAVTATVLFHMSVSRVGVLPAYRLGTLFFQNASSSVMWGMYVYIALLVVALIGNILVAKADIKSDETLEEERLERVRIKEEKEEAERLKKEAARAEAKKKAEQEQAEKIRKAREALAAKENKNK